MSVLRFFPAALAIAALAGTTTAQGEYFVGAQPITSLNQAGSSNFSPTVSEDELYMIFASNRAGGMGGYDLYETTRNNVDDPWSAPVNLVQLNSPNDDYEPNLGQQGSELHFVRAGGGASDILVSTRPTTASPWGPPQPLPPPINGPGLINDDPAMTQDELTMFYSQGGDIFTATRPAVGAPWGNVQPFTPANSAATDHSPMPEGRGDVVWFSSNRAGGPLGSSDWYFVSGDPTTGVYGPPTPVADLSTAGWDSNGARGGCTGRMYISNWVGATSFLWIRCPRAVVVWVRKCIIWTYVPHVQLWPPRIIWRRVWLVSILVPQIHIEWYRWWTWPFGGFCVLAGSIGLNNPPIFGQALLPGAEGDLFLAGSPVILGLTVHPPNQPNGLQSVNFAIPPDPAFIGLNVHFQAVGLENGNNLLTLSQPGTITLVP